MNLDELDYRKTQQMQDLKKCLNIVDCYGAWQEFYKNMTIEIAELYYKNGICCICDADASKMYYMKEGYEI